VQRIRDCVPARKLAGALMPRRNRRVPGPPPVSFQPQRGQPAACATKERYDSEAEARSIALMNAPRGRGTATTPYRCEVCGGWHLTSR
jgi:hypothetical protein